METSLRRLARPSALFQCSRCMRRAISTAPPRKADDTEPIFPPALPASARQAVANRDPYRNYRSTNPRKKEIARAARSKPSETPSQAHLDLAANLSFSAPGSSSSRLTSSSGDHTAAAIARAQAHAQAVNMRKNFTRRFEPGDLYSPHDLSPVEMKKWRISRPGRRDVFDALNMDPLSEWKNVSMLEEFRSQIGKIKHRKETGLRGVNQRKVSKAIRRAVGMAWVPSVHQHPEVLEDLERKRNERRFGLDGRNGIVRQ